MAFYFFRKTLFRKISEGCIFQFRDYALYILLLVLGLEDRIIKIILALLLLGRDHGDRFDSEEERASMSG